MGQQPCRDLHSTARQLRSRCNEEPGNSEQGYSLSQKMTSILRKSLCSVKNGLGERKQATEGTGKECWRPWQGCRQKGGWLRCAEK